MERNLFIQSFYDKYDVISYLRQVSFEADGASSFVKLNENQLLLRKRGTNFVRAHSTNIGRQMREDSQKNSLIYFASAQILVCRYGQVFRKIFEERSSLFYTLGIHLSAGNVISVQNKTSAKKLRSHSNQYLPSVKAKL